jgi:HPt (histidine-containing phosphotransfer) domain-containing protein
MDATVINRAIYAALEESVGGEFITVMVEAFLEETSQLMETLKKSLSAGDADAFRRAAHSMKSNAATFGAMQLSEQARELEAIARAGKMSEIGSRLEVLEEAVRSAIEEIKDLIK